MRKLIRTAFIYSKAYAVIMLFIPNLMEAQESIKFTKITVSWRINIVYMRI